MTRAPWLVALALAGLTGWAVKRSIRVQSELDTIRAQTVPEADATVAAPDEPEAAPPTTAEEKFAIMSLVQAAQIDALEKENVQLKARLAGVEKSATYAKRLKERADNARDLEERERKRWQSRVRAAEKDAREVRDAARQYVSWAEGEMRGLERRIAFLCKRRGVSIGPTVHVRPRPGRAVELLQAAEKTPKEARIPSAFSGSR